MFDLSPSMVWLILLVIFILTEIATVGLLTIWFAGGSLAAFFVSLTQAGTGIQIVIFLIVSFVLVLLIRPLAQKKFNSGHIRTNAQTLIGEEAVVLEPINNLRSQGRVMTMDRNGLREVWMRRKRSKRMQLFWYKASAG